MSYLTSPAIVYPFDTNKSTVLRRYGLLQNALATTDVRRSEHLESLPLIVKSGNTISYAAWHHGSNNKWLAIGDIEAMLHIADLTSDEREHLTLQARRHRDLKAQAIVHASAPHNITTFDQLSRLYTLTLVGLVFFDDHPGKL